MHRAQHDWPWCWPPSPAYLRIHRMMLHGRPYYSCMFYLFPSPSHHYDRYRYCGVYSRYDAVYASLCKNVHPRCRRRVVKRALQISANIIRYKKTKTGKQYVKRNTIWSRQNKKTREMKIIWFCLKSIFMSVVFERVPWEMRKNVGRLQLSQSNEISLKTNGLRGKTTVFLKIIQNIIYGNVLFFLLPIRICRLC